MGRRALGGIMGGAMAALSVPTGGAALIPGLIGAVGGILGASSQHLAVAPLNDPTPSEEGQPLIKVFGRARVPMPLIFTGGLEVTTQGGSGVGGQPPTITTASNLLFIGGVGRITQIERICCNSTLFFMLNPPDPTNPPGHIFVDYDAATHMWNPPVDPNTPVYHPFAPGIGTGSLNGQSVFLTIAGGSRDTVPWLNMEAIRGANNTPAFLGYWWAAFENIDMTQWGNQAPNTTAEVLNSETTDIGYEPNVSTILKWICRETKMLDIDNDLDVSELDDAGLSVLDPGSGDRPLDTLHRSGFVVDTRQPAHAPITQLMEAFHFTLPEVNGKLTARIRGSAATAALSLANLRTTIPGSETPFTEQSNPDNLILPVSSELQFYNQDRRYHAGYAYGYRDNAPGTNKESQSLPLTMQGDAAERIAKIRVHEGLFINETYNLSMRMAQLVLAAGDEITIPTDEGTIQVRLPLVQLPLFGPITSKAYRSDPVIYQAPMPVNTTGLNVPTEGTLGNYTFAIIETNAMNDGMVSSAATGFYIGFTTPWADPIFVAPLPTVTFNQGNIGTNVILFAAGGIFDSPATIGTVVGTNLNDDNPDASSDEWDDITVATVNLVGGTLLTNASDTDVLENDANTIICGREIIKFGTATFVRTEADGTKTFTIQHLMRGFRGTDSWMFEHSNAEPCMMVGAGMAFTDITSRLIGQDVALRVIVGQQFLSITLDAVGYTLYPYSPAVITGSRNIDGDLTVTFEPRTRYSDTTWARAVGGTNTPADTITPADGHVFRVDVWNSLGTEILDTYYIDSTSPSVITVPDYSITIPAADLPTLSGSDYAADPTLPIPVSMAEQNSLVGWGYESAVVTVPGY